MGSGLGIPRHRQELNDKPVLEMDCSRASTELAAFASFQGIPTVMSGYFRKSRPDFRIVNSNGRWRRKSQDQP